MTYIVYQIDICHQILTHVRKQQLIGNNVGHKCQGRKELAVVRHNNTEPRITHNVRLAAMGTMQEHGHNHVAQQNTKEKTYSVMYSACPKVQVIAYWVPHFVSGNLEVGHQCGSS